jgi:carnitine-CoA ligase
VSEAAGYEGATAPRYAGEKTLGAIVATRAAQDPGRELARFEHGTVSCGELDERANRVAHALAGLGVGQGDKAAAMLSNRAEALEAWVGMASAGVVDVPINTAYKGDLLAYLLNQSQCGAIVVEAGWVERLAAVAPQLETLRHVLVVGGEADPVAGLAVHDFDELVAAADPAPPQVEVSPYDTSVILFTSGTTGPSKGVVLTHNANFRLAENACALMDYGPGEVLFTAFPLFHVNARYTTVLPALLLGGRFVMHSRFSASRFWDICRAENVTAFNFMGALLMMLYKQPPRPTDREHGVRKAYGAPAPVTIYEDFERRFGLKLVEAYGSTELGTATMNTVHEFKVGSCGRPVPYYEVEIHDELDRAVAPGREGEICVRPKEPHVMVEEYYRMPEATLRAFRNLWFHTGDRGYADADGWFYYVDRMKDAIRRRGENISSWEVEKVIDSLDPVQESAVVGVPSELTEEDVLAVVVLKEGAGLSPEELLDHCQERMPHFAVPRYVRFVSRLPKTPSQRIEKYILRDQGLTPDTWDRERARYEVRR